MAWVNKNKIHVARGTSTNIERLADTNQFTDGQPLFISDKNYLGIANVDSGLISAKNITPVRVRTVEGWSTDKEFVTGTTNLDSSFTLSSNKSGHYIMSNNGLITFIKSSQDFKLIRENGNNETVVLEMLNNGSVDYIHINDNSYLKSNNIRTRNIYDGEDNANLSIEFLNIDVSGSSLPFMQVDRNLKIINGNRLNIGDSSQSSNNNSLNVYGKSNFNNDIVVSGNTTISNLTVGDSSDSSTLATTARVYGTLRVNCINIVT